MRIPEVRYNSGIIILHRARHFATQKASGSIDSVQTQEISKFRLKHVYSDHQQILQQGTKSEFKPGSGSDGHFLAFFGLRR